MLGDNCPPMMALSEEEGKNVIDLFDTMDIKPEGDELRSWKKNYLESTDKTVKVDQTSTTTNNSSTGFTQHNLKLSSYFSGDEKTKGECSYDLWRYKVKCLLDENAYSEEQLKTVIRRSLKGEAAHVPKRLGSDASVEAILKKIDVVYGAVAAGMKNYLELSEFYSSKQLEGEVMSSWGCRLEDLIDKAVNSEAVGDKDINDMLRRRFWAGLKPKLKEASRHKYDA